MAFLKIQYSVNCVVISLKRQFFKHSWAQKISNGIKEKAALINIQWRSFSFGWKGLMTICWTCNSLLDWSYLITVTHHYYWIFCSGALSFDDRSGAPLITTAAAGLWWKIVWSSTVDDGRYGNAPSDEKQPTAGTTSGTGFKDFKRPPSCGVFLCGGVQSSHLVKKTGRCMFSFQILEEMEKEKDFLQLMCNAGDFSQASINWCSRWRKNSSCHSFFKKLHIEEGRQPIQVLIIEQSSVLNVLGGYNVQYITPLCYSEVKIEYIKKN